LLLTVVPYNRAYWYITVR